MTDKPAIPAAAEPVSDRELLRRFTLDSDSKAFAEIVTRHERLVMSVCRRVTGSENDAEEAFQATFITLARKPRHLRRIRSLSSWLYVVARRISARLVRTRRKYPVQPLTSEPPAQAPDPLQRIADVQDALALDEELQGLPSHYRDVLVMTYFANQTSQQIAEQLDVSKGTVDGRIRQARNLLRVRLARRGVGIGVLAAASALTADTAASAAPAVISNTIEIGTQTLSQSLPGTTDLSNLEPLIRPEMTHMITTKLLLSAVAGLAVLTGLAGMIDHGPGTASRATDTGLAAVDTQDADGAAPAVTAAGRLPAANATLVAVPARPRAAASTADNAGESSMATAYTTHPKAARPAEKWLWETLDKPVIDLQFDEGTSLETILEMLTESFSDEQHKFRVWPDLIALESYDIPPLDELRLRRKVDLDGVTLDSALQIILSLSVPEGTQEPLLDFTIKNEVLTLTTPGALQDCENYILRVYDVQGLLPGTVTMPEPLPLAARGSFGPADPQKAAPAVAPIHPDPTPPGFLDLIMEMTSPEAEWQSRDGSGGTIAMAGKRLVIYHKIRVHREVVNLLNELTAAE